MTIDCEIWLLVDEAGNYVASEDEDQAGEKYADAGHDVMALRRVKVTVKVPLPKPVEITAVVEDEEADELTTASAT